MTLAPDARLRAPKRALPPLTVDCHAHLFDRFERYPFSGERKYSPPLCTREAWLALHAALGIERGVQVNGSPYAYNNTITEDFLREHRGRFLGVAMIHPSVEEPDLRRLGAAGFRAARVMDQFPTGATTTMLEAIAERIAPLGWHLEINIAKPEDWVELEPRLRRLPVPLVFDHMGRPRGGAGIDQPGFKAVRRLLAERDDCWTKIASFYRLSDAGPPRYADMRPFVQAVLNDRPDRCVWGTNWPHPGLERSMPNDADLVDLLETWIPRESMRVPLFAANAAKLYRFS
ncbi:MAG TPA: amidohydrolase family protein [Burkholderiales bacterium]|nr:amidohydrolase family protein [Burkholderiales bacterium]